VFFLCADTAWPLIQRIVRESHYLGLHSDKHVLYCPQDGPKKTAKGYQFVRVEDLLETK
jgi:peptidoglycan/xylan/chitin deacetylase (PgdA/CDA1 family)